jgi:biotin carboxyl carrier protein
MTAYDVTVEGEPATPPDGWRVEWLDAERRIARLTDGDRSIVAVVEGAGTDWVVTLHGRRIAVRVRSWRERTIDEAEGASRSHGGPLEVRATLPGLVVAVAVAVGDEVAEGDRLLTIEAMKMQNEVRAPRDGRVAEVAVEGGRVVATGAVLLRLD